MSIKIKLHICSRNKSKYYMKKLKFYMAPVAETVELSIGSSLMQASLTSTKPDFGWGITDGWED